MDEAFIYVAVISGLFTLAAISLMNVNWFKRERFKFETSNLKKQNDLQLKKMARDLGISKSLPPQPQPSGNVGGLLDLAKGLSTDQLGAIADIIRGNEETEGGGGIEGIDDLIAFATKNPEIVKSFLSGAKGGSGGDTGYLGD